MESQPQNPEFRNNPENFHPCNTDLNITRSFCGSKNCYKGIIGKRPWSFSYNSFVNCPYISQFTYNMALSYGPKQSVIKGLHSTRDICKRLD